MVKYKEKYLEMKSLVNKLKANRIDLSEGATNHRLKFGIPIILHKWRFRIEEHDDKYLLYDVPQGRKNGN